MARKDIKNRKVPKVRSWVRPTKVHTPKPKRRVKYPLRDLERDQGIYK